MSTELDKIEVTVYFYGLFHYKVLMYRVAHEMSYH